MKKERESEGQRGRMKEKKGKMYERVKEKCKRQKHREQRGLIRGT